MSEIQILDIAPRLAAVVRKTVPLARMAEAQREARGALDAALKAANVRPHPRPLTVWRPPRDSTMDYAPGVFVSEPFEPGEGVSLFTLPKGRAAHLTLRGPYDGLPAAWRRLFDDCGARGWKPAGLNWEVYAALGTPAADLETDLYALLA